MKFDEMTIKEAREISAMFGTKEKSTAYRVGDKVLIRTVTMNQTGRISEVYPEELVLEDAAWIADTGRFSNALKTGELSEVESADGRVIVNRGAIVDVYEWHHNLPREVK